MESLLWAALYPLWADSVRVDINLDCNTDLKVPLTVGTHSEPSRGSNKKIIIMRIIMICFFFLIYPFIHFRNFPEASGFDKSPAHEKIKESGRSMNF